MWNGFCNIFSSTVQLLLYKNPHLIKERQRLVKRRFTFTVCTLCLCKIALYYYFNQRWSSAIRIIIICLNRLFLHSTEYRRFLRILRTLTYQPGHLGRQSIYIKKTRQVRIMLTCLLLQNFYFTKYTLWCKFCVIFQKLWKAIP
jgi:hypothetical protein